jgi:hypothetical protein
MNRVPYPFWEEVDFFLFRIARGLYIFERFLIIASLQLHGSAYKGRFQRKALFLFPRWSEWQRINVSTGLKSVTVDETKSRMKPVMHTRRGICF